jgi:hypothetical protein
MSIRTIRTGATAMVEASFLQFITDFLAISGVLDIINGTQLVVSAGTGLSVSIAVGRAYLLASAGDGYPIINDATVANLAITANSSGNPRYTSTVLYIDVGASANAAATNVAKIINVDGTPAASPTPPDNTAILAATGAGCPYIVLANVLVNSGASVPTSITDTRPQAKWRSDLLNQDEWVVVAGVAGGTTTLDLSKGKKFQINLGAGNTTLALLNVPLICKSIDLRITQDGIGSRVITYFSGLSWPGAVVPTSSGASKTDEYVINFLTVTSDSVNTSEGFIVGQNI